MAAESASWYEQVGSLLGIGAAAGLAWWSQWREGRKEDDHSVQGKQVVLERAELADLNTTERTVRDFKEAVGRLEQLLNRLLELETSNREDWRTMHEEFRSYERDMRAYVERNRTIRDENHHMLEASHDMLKEVSTSVRRLIQEMEFSQRLEDRLSRLRNRQPGDDT